jgi:phosphatidylserine/phosphatidylglycerophosphate/cardiolipin synthase-like enzyme
VQGPPRPVAPGSVGVWFDLSGLDSAGGGRRLEQTIFDEILRRISSAQRLIVLDFFLWNDWTGAESGRHRGLARELADALLRKRAERPDLPILVLTDPFNRLYGRHAPGFFDELERAGIPVVFTDVFRLRESNVPYGRPARALSPLIRGLPGLDQPRIANPVHQTGGRLSFREAGRLARFKANHRKVLIADEAGGPLGLLVTSLNPADGSSAHANVALTVSGAVAQDALDSELSIAEWSLTGPYAPDEAGCEAARHALRQVRSAASAADAPVLPEGGPRAQWLTEGAIRESLLESLAESGPGDEIAILLFYLSDRGILRALIGAAERGARVRVVLDLNRDAFGRRKIGIPNRPVAAELVAAGRRFGGRLEVRWAVTRGEQFHIKAMAIRNPARGRYELHAGSTNWTRRNLCDLNLEANLRISGDPGSVNRFFDEADRLWSNRDRVFTEPYEARAERGWAGFWKALLGSLQERTGLGSF